MNPESTITCADRRIPTSWDEASFFSMAIFVLLRSRAALATGAEYGKVDEAWAVLPSVRWLAAVADRNAEPCIRLRNEYVARKIPLIA